MTEHNLITKKENICLLEDDQRIFLLDQDGSYMNAERMKELAKKILDTAEKYGNAIDEYNNKLKWNRACKEYLRDN